MILIKSENIAVGKKLKCVRPMAVLLTTGLDYEIISITDDTIFIMDNENDRTFPLLMSMNKNESPNVFRYFKIW